MTNYKEAVKNSGYMFVNLFRTYEGSGLDKSKIHKILLPIFLEHNTLSNKDDIEFYSHSVGHMVEFLMNDIKPTSQFNLILYNKFEQEMLPKEFNSLCVDLYRRSIV